jgi:hypothetical protein
MITNENLTNEYGPSKIIGLGDVPVEYKPRPNKNDYDRGFITRFFSKKVNESKIIEIDPAKIRNINAVLYFIVSLNWKISGSREKVIINGIIDKTGVIDSNNFEIERVKIENGIDLSNKLSNRLEFWRGY